MIAAGHGWGLAAFPLAASLIALAFTLVLAARVARRLRPHELVWAVALAMYAAASFAMFLGVVRGWPPVMQAMQNVHFPATLAEALDEIVARRGDDGRLRSVLATSSFLVNGAPAARRMAADLVLPDEAIIEVLPQFAGG